ncbi:hypothetical protein HAX54_037124 [Datura stramonium]|uniref:Uncharacterized protein n=1 Tax=Datura stramonium TaxID=4076 RepID=A0ABS8VL51_DATST|nr:hypothetical protein [Datura stramonium]
MWFSSGPPVNERGERGKGGGAGFRVERRREWRDVVSLMMVVFRRRESEIWRGYAGGVEWVKGEVYGSELCGGRSNRGAVLDYRIGWSHMGRILGRLGHRLDK